jgi:hypothetical protein
MRTIAILLLSFLSLSLSIAADVRWTYSDFTTTAQTVKKVYITPIASYGTNGNTIITGDRRVFTNDSAGSLIVSNLIVGRSYRVEFKGAYTDTVITNSFDSTVTGFVEAVNYIAAPLSDGGLTSYSKTAADARFHNVSGDTSTNAAFRGTFKIPAGASVGYVLTATNADGSGAWQVGTSIAAGTNIVTVTNGSLVTVHGTANVTQAGLAAGSYAVNGALATNFAHLPVYNVELYGADHNSAGTNDHWAVQRAVDAATNTGGGIIFFPNGDYWFTNRTFHPKFTSEGAISCITLWSNCTWVLLGEGNATLKLQPQSAGNFVLIGSGNWSTGSNPWDGGNPFYTWNSAERIHLKDLNFDMMDTTQLYDMIEVHSGRTFLAENCKFLNNMNTTGDAIDVDGWSVIAKGCTFSNWNGSIFHPNNQASGVAIFKENFVTNCNTSWSLNTGFDASSSSTGFDIINCDFRNVGNVMKVEGGKTVRIVNSSFTFMTHAVVGTKTNLWIQGNLECSGSTFAASGTANTIGPIVLDGTSSSCKINASSFINSKAVWMTNAIDVSILGCAFVGADAPIRLGGTMRSCIIADNQFGVDPATGNSVFGLAGVASSANNVMFSGNNLIGYSPVCAGTNWTVINNTLRASSTAYFHDGSFGNNRFINNMTLPFGNPANELRLGGPSNYVSGNVLNDVQILSSSATANYFCDNIVETGVFTYFGGNETFFRSGGSVIQNNYDRKGNPLFASPTRYEALWATTNLATTVLDMSKAFSVISLSANTTLTAPSGVDTSGKVVQNHTCIVTNSSGSGDKTITFPASWIGNTGVAHYVTNQSVISIAIYPGAGTNAIIRNLK